MGVDPQQVIRGKQHVDKKNIWMVSYSLGAMLRSC